MFGFRVFSLTKADWSAEIIAQTAHKMAYCCKMKTMEHGREFLC